MKRFALVWLLLAVTALPAHAGGPRYITGRPYFTGQSGRPIGWPQGTLRYYTDPADLSAAVPHAAADALVAAAVNTWNQPVAGITLTRGGTLAEHPSAANTFVDTAGLELPADAMRTNAAAIPLAILYDTDGSITDLLLGSGASSPSACRSNAVTESVDAFDPAGTIAHAFIVINGRCSGTAPEKELELQYKLTRALGRVLGLAWSQGNDNVFTGTPTPTYNQAMHWPLMHPIDIICGPYAYQCLPSPFLARPDDLAALVLVYPLTDPATLPAGKQLSLANANALHGSVEFPNGMGMAGVNVLVRRQVTFTSTTDAWVEASAVSGATYRRAAVAPFLASPTDALSSMGDGGQDQLGAYTVAYLPLLDNVVADTLVASTEAVNPLYARSLSLGPYGPGDVLPAGSAPPSQSALGVYAGSFGILPFTMPGAPATCGNGADGTAPAPAQVPASGWWTATLCPIFHASNLIFDVKPGHTFTIETTALGSDGLASTAKAMPLLALYAASDNWWNYPSLGVTPAAFNGLAAATTAISASTGTSTRQRFAIADQRGEGRPDFLYQGRVFYADSVEPPRFPLTGGTITITGMGFRLGNSVLINGAPVTVTAWTPTAITATVPTPAQLKVTRNPVDVQVLDRGTGASSLITGALTFDPSPALPNAMILLASPGGNVLVGDPAASPFAVKVVAQDGITPVANLALTLSTSQGQVRFGACGAASCTLATDASGTVSSTVTPLAAGAITLTATAGTLQQTGVFTALSKAADMQVTSQPPATVNVGESQSQPFGIRLLDGSGASVPFRPVTFTVPAGSAIFNACFASTCTQTTDQGGNASVNMTATAAGPITLQASGAGLSRQLSLTAVPHDDTLVLEAAPDPQVYVNEYSTSLVIRLLRPDGVTGDYGQPVTFSAPAGVLFANCGANVCQLTTNTSGRVGTPVLPSRTGVFPLRISFGNVFVSATITVTARTQTMRLVSSPTGTLTTGVTASIPFAAEVIDFDGVTTFPGLTITLAGPNDGVLLNVCGKGDCLVYADGGGVASTPVTPLKAGTFTLSAIYLGLQASATITVVDPADVLELVAAPTGNVFVGDPLDVKLRLLQPDGVTPDAGKNVTLAVTTGSFSPTGCAGTPCTAVTDAAGNVTFHGIATAPGAITLTAAYGSVTRAVSFQAIARPDVMRLVSAPASPSFTGDVSPAAFTVQMLLADGVTPAAGRPVTFSVTQGNASLAACSQSPCTLATDVNGRASTTVTPLVAGFVALSAASGSLSIPASFTAVDHPDTLQLTSAPAGPAFVGDIAQPAFAVKVLAYDGSPLANRSVTFTVSAGSARFNACTANICTLQTDSSGTASTTVTPLVAGAVSILATYGTLTQAANFQAVNHPDTLQLSSAPAGPAFVGDIAQPAFGVKVLAYDGTPLANRSVSFTVSAGSARFNACASTPCTLQTDSSGTASNTVTPLVAGAVSILATYGTLTQAANFQAVNHPDNLQLTSAPASPAFVGDDAQPAFGVKLLAYGGTPLANRSVTFTLTTGSARFNACAANICTLQTDSSGAASTTVTPLVAGAVSILATYGTLTQAANFQAVNHPDTLQLTSSPASPAFVGDIAQPAFAVKVLAYDGTPLPNRSVTFTVSAGSARFNACASTPCTLQTDSSGTASTAVTPLAAGAVSILATYGTLTQAATVTAVLHPDTFALVSAPASPAFVGDLAQPAFAVRVLAYDGSPLAGAPILFGVTSGSARFGGCPAIPCTLTTDATGVASTTVTPLAAGPIALLATYGAFTQSAVLTAIDHPDTLERISAPSGSAAVGDVAQPAFTVSVVAYDGTPRAGRAVTFSSAGAAVSLDACPANPCTVLTGPDGRASTYATPVGAGAATLTARYGNLTQTADFQAVDKPLRLLVVSAPADGAWTGEQAATPFLVRLVKADGVTPVAGQAVTFRSAEAGFGANGAASIVVLTDANGEAAAQVTPTRAGTVTLSSAQGTLVQTVTFQAATHPDLLQVVTQPPDGALAGDPAVPPFTVLLTAFDGVTARPNQPITFAVTGGSALLGPCNQPACTQPTDANGLAATSVTPTAAGSIIVQATAGSLTRSITFTAVAKPDLLLLIGAPTGTAWTGEATAVPFLLRVVQADGITAVPKRDVILSSATATFSACPSTPCILATDDRGEVSSTVVPTLAGTVTITAQSDSLTQTASFTAADRPPPTPTPPPDPTPTPTPDPVPDPPPAKPDTLTLVGAPSGSPYVGDVIATPFAVRVLDGAGLPASGRTVVFAVATGAATLNPCCALVTGPDGIASVVLTPSAAGPLTITATAAGTTLSVTLLAIAKPPVLALLAAHPSFYLAADGISGVSLTALLTADGAPSAGATLTWTPAGPGMQPGQPQTVTNAAGVATVYASVGPLATNSQASVQACASATVCAVFNATAVSPQDLHIDFADGAGQETTGAYRPVTLLVTDAAQHPVAAAPVTIYQTVTAYAAPCPTSGRCPAQPILGSQWTQAVTGSDGQVAFPPATRDDTATQTNITVTAGPFNAANTVLFRRP